MARKKRIYRLNSCHHVILRGNDGQRIFRDESDRVHLCLIIQKASERHDFKIHAFCFMGNHIHLVLEPKYESLSIAVHGFAFYYAQVFNRKYKRKGYLYQGRFKSFLVEDERYLKALVRYIHLNPVRAELTKLPEDYRWSSHRAYMGHDTYTWLEQERVLKYFGKIDREAREEFCAFVGLGTEAEGDLEQMRKAVTTGVLGSEEFIESLKMETSKERKTIPEKVSIEQLIGIISDRFEVKKEDIVSEKRRRNLLDARAVLASIVRESDHINFKDCSKALGRDSTYFSKLARKVELNRDLQQHTLAVMDLIDDL